MLGLKETKAKRDQATQDQNLPTSWKTPQETKLGKIKIGNSLELSGISQETLSPKVWRTRILLGFFWAGVLNINNALSLPVFQLPCCTLLLQTFLA